MPERREQKNWHSFLSHLLVKYAIRGAQTAAVQSKSQSRSGRHTLEYPSTRVELQEASSRTLDSSRFRRFQKFAILICTTPRRECLFICFKRHERAKYSFYNKKRNACSQPAKPTASDNTDAYALGWVRWDCGWVQCKEAFLLTYVAFLGQYAFWFSHFKIQFQRVEPVWIFMTQKHVGTWPVCRSCV